MKKVVSEADGYQPHLIAPEQGYRRLIDGALNYFRGPAEASVDAVSSRDVLSGYYFSSNSKRIKLMILGFFVGSLCFKRACEEINS